MNATTEGVEMKEECVVTDWSVVWTVRSGWYGGTEAANINEAMRKAFTDEVQEDVEECFHKWMPIQCCRFVEVSSDELNKHMVVDLEDEEDLKFLRSIGVDIDAIMGK